MAGPEGITLAASVLFRSETITIVINYETMPVEKESRDIVSCICIEHWFFCYWRLKTLTLEESCFFFDWGRPDLTSAKKWNKKAEAVKTFVIRRLRYYHINYLQSWWWFASCKYFLFRVWIGCGFILSSRFKGN